MIRWLAERGPLLPAGNALAQFAVMSGQLAAFRVLQFAVISGQFAAAMPAFANPLPKMPLKVPKKYNPVHGSAFNHRSSVNKMNAFSAEKSRKSLVFA